MIKQTLTNLIVDKLSSWLKSCCSPLYTLDLSHSKTLTVPLIDSFFIRLCPLHENWESFTPIFQSENCLTQRQFFCQLFPDILGHGHFSASFVSAERRIPFCRTFTQLFMHYLCHLLSHASSTEIMFFDFLYTQQLSQCLAPPPNRNVKFE